MKKTIPLVLVAGCFAQLPTAPSMPSQAQIEAQQKEATARSMGYPTHKSAADLETMIQQQTKDFRLAKKLPAQQLPSLALAIDGVKGTCYTFVMRLADGAAWGPGAEAGLRFDFQSAGGNGSGGPGVAGPGAVVSVGCAEVTGPIQLSAAPMIGHDPIGSGSVSIELWTHVLTKAEAAHLEADKQQQIEEARRFKEEEDAKQQARLQSGCNRCQARYQGCLGAGWSRGECQEKYRDCAFEEAGPEWMSACPSPE